MAKITTVMVRLMRGVKPLWSMRRRGPRSLQWEDDDCDGEVDEGVRNACGGCGPTPEEVCNGVDDDCDGIIDEGAVNACGRCGEPCYDFEWTGVDAWNAGDREGTEVDPQQGVTLGQSQWSMPFIWIANSGENTVSKLNTDTGIEVGRYRMPSGTSSPSRTAVDLDGNVWVGLRGGGSAVKIALAEADCIDRNNNGQIETSRDNNNNGRIDGGELLNTGADECLVLDVRPGGSRIRAVAIDAENRVWAGRTVPSTTLSMEAMVVSSATLPRRQSLRSCDRWVHALVQQSREQHTGSHRCAKYTTDRSLECARLRQSVRHRSGSSRPRLDR